MYLHMKLRLEHFYFPCASSKYLSHHKRRILILRDKGKYSDSGFIKMIVDQGSHSNVLDLDIRYHGHDPRVIFGSFNCKTLSIKKLQTKKVDNHYIKINLRNIWYTEYHKNSSTIISTTNVIRGSCAFLDRRKVRWKSLNMKITLP